VHKRASRFTPTELSERTSTRSTPGAAPHLQIAYDKVERRVELSATVSEAVADAFENAKALQTEGSSVVVRDIAGARFVSRYDARIVERARLPT
jgi:hypothetical protein